MSLDNLIRTAIANKQLLEFNYDGYHRIAEPHVYGIKDGVHEILVFQVGGESSSGVIQGWKRMKLDKVLEMSILDQLFAGPRPSYGKHSSFDTTIAVVR